MSAYGRFSEVYDRLLYDAPAQDWLSYMEGLLGLEGPARILEYACGSGRLTAPLAARGHEVIGVDRSRGMLMKAQEKVQGLRNCRLVEADMTAFSLDHPADAAICALDGVNYLTSPALLRAFFVCAAANLKEGAPFVFDVSSAWKVEHVLAEEFFYDDGEEETLFWTNSYDRDSRLLEMSLTVFARREEGYERFDETHLIRAWETEELETALRAAGFSKPDIFAFGTRQAPEAGTERIVLRTRKGD